MRGIISCSAELIREVFIFIVKFIINKINTDKYTIAANCNDRRVQLPDGHFPVDIFYKGTIIAVN